MQVPRIVSLLITTRGLDKVAAAPTGAPGGADTVAVDGHLAELTSMLACCHEFIAFLTKTAADAVHPKPQPREVTEALRGGQYAHAAQELQAAYVRMERVYLERSVAKAVQLDAVVLVRPSQRTHALNTRVGASMIAGRWCRPHTRRRFGK